MHLLFYGNPSEPQKLHSALSSYYKKQYNRDSSRLTALALPYRVFQAGFSLPSWHLYGTPEESQLGRLYSAWLEDERHLQEAARLEHDRWNQMMLSLGWETASAAQVAAYVHQGNPGHQMHIGRLHPFITDWDTFDNESLVPQIQSIIQSRFPEKSVQDPREADAVVVQMTENLLSIPSTV